MNVVETMRAATRKIKEQRESISILGEFVVHLRKELEELKREQRKSKI